MTRRDCPECGASAVLSTRGMERVYQGTRSWKHLRDAYNRLENHPHKSLLCTNCENLV